MTCPLCTRKSSTPSPALAHRHRHANAPPPALATPEGAQAFRDAPRQDQLSQTLEFARSLIERAVLNRDDKAVMTAARFFLQCQVHLDRQIDPIAEERRLRDAARRAALNQDREAEQKSIAEMRKERQATLYFFERHMDLHDEFCHIMDLLDAGEDPDLERRRNESEMN